MSISKLVPKFKITSLRQMDMDTKNAYSSCVSDVRLTGDLTFAKQSTASLAITLATRNLPAKTNLQPMLDKAYALIKKTDLLIDSALKEFLNSPATSGTSANKDDKTVVYPENQGASLSCMSTYAGVIRIVSASYDSLSSSCSMDVTERVNKLCATHPRSCKFTVSNTVFPDSPCGDEDKQLKIIFHCSK